MTIAIKASNYSSFCYYLSDSRSLVLPELSVAGFEAGVAGGVSLVSIRDLLLNSYFQN